MKKKILVVFFCILCVVCCSIALAACEETSDPNVGGNTTSDPNVGGNTTSDPNVGGNTTSDPNVGGNTTSDPHVHDWGEWILTTPATCTQKGEETRTCKLDPNHKETREIAINPSAHDYNEWQVTTPANCTEQGVETRTCKFDHNHIETREIAINPNAHKYNIENKCELCNYVLEYTQGLEYEINSDNTAYILIGKGQAEETDIVVPYYYEGLPVTSIGSSAFASCRSLTSITIPDSVTAIGSSAFRDCTSLTSITIPDSVTFIGDRAFDGCTNLTSITIPDSVTSIGSSAFEYCTSLESITIPDSVTSIGYSAFYGCRSLTGVYITDLKAWCNIKFGGFFANPLWYAHNLYLNNNLVTAITADMLQGVTSIGDNAFYYCTNLKSITIPDSVISIGEEAFGCCTSLTSITIPDSVTSIGSYAFRDCTSLTSINIPDSVTSIGEGAFNNCKSLTSITVGENNTAYSSQDGILYNKDKTKFLHIPTAIKGSVTIPDGVTSIGDRAFYECTSLTSITIPDSVTSIGYSAFYGCTNLIQTQDGVKYVDKWVVGYDNNIVSSVTLRQDTKGIVDYAFSGCTRLKSITIPDSVTSIGVGAFRGCLNLKSITIPDSVTSIGNYAFYNCTSLTSVTFENPNGWKVSKNSDMSNAIDVTLGTATENATYLTTTYYEYYWHRYDN